MRNSGAAQLTPSGQPTKGDAMTKTHKYDDDYPVRTTRGADPAASEPEAPAELKRTADDVYADVQREIAGLTGLSPSGIESAAARLQVLVGELRTAPEAK